MQNNEIANRYAKALFSLASENNNAEKVFSEIREIKKAIYSDENLENYLNSTMASKNELQDIFSKTFSSQSVSTEVTSFINLLIEKERFSIFSNVVDAFEKTIDETNGVTRGTVRSSIDLSPTERQAVEEKVSKALKKKVIFTYLTDETIIGGLVVEVGGYRFDDTLISHLRRLKEEIKRHN